jgi:hypothetical protein
MEDLPPFQYYPSREELELDLAIYATIGGYKWIIRRSRTHWGGSEWPTILYACNRWRQGYQFSILAKENSYELWYLQQRTKARFSHHNHGPREPREPPSRQLQEPQEPPSQPQEPPSRQLQEPLEKKLPTCSKCHREGHRRGAKCCILRGQESP